MTTTERDELLNSGLTVEPHPTHPYLKEGWVRPTAPEGYPNLVVINTPSKTTMIWVMDFLCTESGVFASEEQTIDATWPWVDGFEPFASDWEMLGIPALY